MYTYSVSKGFNSPSRGRAILPPRVLPEAAASELGAVFGGIAFSGAALYGLALMIRDANNFDAKDERLMAERLGRVPERVDTPVVAVTEKQQIVAVPDTAEIEQTVEDARAWIASWRSRVDVTAPDTADIKERAEEARAWISSWKEKTAEMIQAAEQRAKEAEEKALEAKKKMEAAEADLVRIEAERDVKRRSEEARIWIAAWKDRSKQLEDSPSLAADPDMAAEVLRKMTEDTPVGVQQSEKDSVREPALAGGRTTVTDSHQDSGAVVEKTGTQTLRRVSITSEYETKIKSLISNYEKSKQVKESMMPRETVTVAEEEVAAAEMENLKRTNPVVLFFLRIVAMIQAFISYVKSLFSGPSPQGPSTQTA